ncbi:unnamed protein product [Phaedon cochleariae]|uniref:Sm domain-containing protein n=1 Tax=Phaedon cochleariae TaxID=80249 RepID=A0A9P0DQC7_PHACE|nr:unnamed protein product [Phaedon cochleariae]
MSRMESVEQGDSKFITSGKEKFLYYNTLAIIVKALEGSYTLIDLRNENTVSGKIARVDGWMNIEMEDVVFYDSRGTKHGFSQFFVCKRNIRYVHIPKGISTTDLIEKQLNKLSHRPKHKKPHTFKKSRANRYQQETVNSLFSVRAPKQTAN